MTVAVRRRSSSRDEEPEEREERPSRRRSRDDDDSREERGSRRGRSRDRDEEPEEEERPRRGRRSRDDDDDKPTRGRSSRRSRDDDDDKPSRGRGRGRGSDEGGSRRRGGTGGFGSYSSKKASTGSFADEFKAGTNTKILIKILDEEPFDSYNQHWIDDMPKGERKSYVCLDDDYFGPEDERDECPLCEIGEKQKTFALFNIVDLSNSRKPEVKVWSASPAVADYLERASKEKKTSPINDPDLYWEVELQKKGQKYNWVLTPIKARDLPEDFDMDPLEDDEIEEFENDLYDDRSAITKVDSYDALQELADDLVK